MVFDSMVLLHGLLQHLQEHQRREVDDIQGLNSCQDKMFCKLFSHCETRTRTHCLTVNLSNLLFVLGHAITSGLMVLVTMLVVSFFNTLCLKKLFDIHGV